MGSVVRNDFVLLEGAFVAFNTRTMLFGSTMTDSFIRFIAYYWILANNYPLL